ncbi:probable acriflavine sensitivity control protein ACR-2 [Rhynchosporium secalis]|uniref:Probable acriflavine sensitivity control protein ACR-2 n=1 Tax=Rhynchosporium secalis TaxID=38038 RepID=A0A1E1MHH7_RHYSE|nr:probable acriflavine sensitivity control protein ACR-2 [Rhynchosporium secalis]
METVTIPSPTAFLASPDLKPAPEPPPPPKRKPPSTKRSTPAAKNQGGIVKPKQSKSRNGCITCKSKRLKCDETKPTCEQCKKRNVTCGGYKKDFKWRPFEETTFNARPAVPKPKRDSIVLNKPPELVPSPSDGSTISTPGAEPEQEMSIPDSFFHVTVPTPSSSSYTPPQFENSNFHPPMFDMSTPPYMRALPRPRFEADSVTRSLSSLFDDTTPPTTSRPSLSGQSPSLIDLLLPGSELNARPGTVTMPPLVENMMPSMDMSPMMDDSFLPMEMNEDPAMEDGIEEVIRRPQMSDADLWMSIRNPTHSRSSTTSPTSLRDDPFSIVYRQPEVQAGSQEMLMLRFDKQTCGILSVKDGPTENPWRTLIWPLARNSTPLYHAIASLTAFHTSKEKPSLRVDGMEHMRKSIRALATGIENMNMRTDEALATTLVLAFSESWDQHISTGIEHLRGAKILVNQALVSHKKRNLSGDDLARLKFLCNTWVYMNVLARLTSMDDDESNDFEAVLDPLSTTFDTNCVEIDPLMGCAASLFPLIGRVANLCRKVRKVHKNSIAIISQAMELKEAIVQWSPPPLLTIERPEDPTSEIQHAVQTAEAYRYATLLHLHQAVPEIPSWTSEKLADKVLEKIVTVPLSSRFVIVQIYPLLAAGCESLTAEDRATIEDRWASMASRMWIGNIDRCWEVTREVWARRDAAEAARSAAERGKMKPGMSMMVHSESSKRKFEEEMAMDDSLSFSDMLHGSSSSKRHRHSRSLSGTLSPMGRLERKRVHEPMDEEMDPELTIRGRMHWVGVMKDWEWEILLG